MNHMFGRSVTLIGLLLAVRSAVAADDLTKPIQVSPDGHFLMQPDGRPFFYLGENVETLFWRLTREETEFYLKDRAAKGFTVVLAQIVPKGDIIDSSALNWPNAYGETAFVGGDVSRPNEKYFEHIDWVVERAHSYGLRVALAPAQMITHVAHHVFNEANAEAYGRWLGTRYRGKGIIWMLGWDATPLWPELKVEGGQLRRGVVTDYRPVFDLLAKGITEGEGDDPFISFHITGLSFSGTAHPRTSLYFHESAWLDMNTIQSSHFLDQSGHEKDLGADFGWNSTYNYEPTREEYDSEPTRPVIDAEPQYDEIPRNEDPDVSAGRFDEVDIRNSAYHAVFAGAAGHDYNNLNVVGFHILKKGDRPTEDDELHPNKPWKQALDAPGARQIHHVKDLMLSRPYFTRIPDQSVIVGDTEEGAAHISATRDRQGSYVMVYLPQGQAVVIDVNKLAGLSAVAWWYDPRTGQSRRIPGNVRTNHAERFTPPTQGRGNDWILVIDEQSRNFPAPGRNYEQP